MTGEHGDVFLVTNPSKQPCGLDGYPQVSLSHEGRRLAFVYLNGGGLYVTERKPQHVTLGPGRRAYFLVAKYRCDQGVLSTTSSIRVTLPNATAATPVNLSEHGVAALDYCKQPPGDHVIDPGNRVTVSPVEPSLLAAQPGP